MTYYKGNSETHKECGKCKRYLSVSEYYKDSSRKNGISAYCKECSRMQNNSWRARNPHIMKESQRNTMRKRTYGISAEDYNLLLESQNFSCRICLKEIGREAAVDHCHKTAVVRGLLCRKCNSAIGLLGEDIDSFQRAIDYLKIYQ